jgi:peptidoglycan/xylan/chitin deacetylase (PgdA/CDA1 family)
MKYIRAFISVLLAVVGISCASRPSTMPEIIPVTTSATTTVSESLIRFTEEPREPFERALWNIKMDTPLFKKYIEGGPALLSGLGIDGAENIVVIGESLIDGNEFRVTYNLANAVQIDKDNYYIPFYLTNLTNGVSRSDAIFWNPIENEAGILLSFDDDFWNVWRQYFGLFESFGAKITFFVQGRFEPNDIVYLSAYSDPPSETINIVDFCFEALNRGHDIGFHSINHPDLRSVSRERFNSETIEAAEPFFRAGIHFSAFGFPYGFSEPWMRDALVPFFPFTRGYGTNIRFYDSETITSRYVISKAIDNIVFPDDDKFESDIRLMLLAAKFSGSHIIPFTTHDISDTAQWGITPERLEFVLKTTQELKLRFYTYSNAATINNTLK